MKFVINIPSVKKETTFNFAIVKIRDTYFLKADDTLRYCSTIAANIVREKEGNLKNLKKMYRGGGQIKILANSNHLLISGTMVYMGSPPCELLKKILDANNYKYSIAILGPTIMPEVLTNWIKDQNNDHKKNAA